MSDSSGCSDTRLRVEPLSVAAFAPFGDVIEPAAAKRRFPINGGTALRHHDLFCPDTDAEQGRCVVSLLQAQPRHLPFELRVVERHPLGSQAFVPLNADQDYLVVVALDPSDRPRAFLAQRGQGINYHRGTWHHPLIALHKVGDFLVIDRDGPGDNCEEVALSQSWWVDTLTID